MAATLSYLQVSTPKHALTAGSSIRTGIDDCLFGKVELDDLQKRYPLFTIVARFSLRNQFVGSHFFKVGNQIQATSPVSQHH
jgi:hypothetical protein